MTSPIQESELFEVVPPANFTSLADEVKPIGAEAVGAVTDSKTEWQTGLQDPVFAVDGLEYVPTLLDMTVEDSEDFKDALDEVARVLSRAAGDFQTFETEREQLAQRIQPVNERLASAKAAESSADPEDENYDQVKQELDDAIKAVEELREDIEDFNKRLEQKEQSVASEITAISNGTEVRETTSADGQIEYVTTSIGNWPSLDLARATLAAVPPPNFFNQTLPGEFLYKAATYFKPPLDKHPVEFGIWALNRSLKVSKDFVGTYLAYSHWGRFAPRTAAGRFAPWRAMADGGMHARSGLLPYTWVTWAAAKKAAGPPVKWYQRITPEKVRVGWKYLDSKWDKGSWVAKRSTGAKGWRGKTMAFLDNKWVKRGGNVLTVASAGAEQYFADEGKGYETSERVGRTATRATTQGGSAIVGGMAGAKAGAAIGTVVGGPVGTVVGGVAGGIIGSVAGSTVGGKVADAVVDKGGKAAKAVGDFFGGLFGGD